MSQDDDEEDSESQRRFLAFAHRILELFEERYDFGDGDVPEACFIFPISNPWSGITHNSTSQTTRYIPRASEVAIRMFYEDNPEAMDDPHFSVMEIVDDIIDSVTSIVFAGVPDGPGHGKSPASLDHQSAEN
jgi:hypothetical protein